MKDIMISRQTRLILVLLVLSLYNPGQRSFAEDMVTETPNVTPVSFADLQRNPKSYSGKLVRITGILEFASETVTSSSAYLSECGDTSLGSKAGLKRHFDMAKYRKNMNAPNSMSNDDVFRKYLREKKPVLFVSLFLLPIIDYNYKITKDLERLVVSNLIEIDKYCISVTGFYENKNLELVHGSQGGVGVIRVYRIGLTD
jgi:hypothetical protein